MPHLREGLQLILHDDIAWVQQLFFVLSIYLIHVLLYYLVCSGFTD